MPALAAGRGGTGRGPSRVPGCAPPADLDFLERFEPERICQDPKDCELWVTRTKPEETLVEVRSDTDVQIVHLSCL
jgi:hypothetical protein